MKRRTRPLAEMPLPMLLGLAFFGWLGAQILFVGLELARWEAQCSTLHSGR